MSRRRNQAYIDILSEIDKAVNAQSLYLELCIRLIGLLMPIKITVLKIIATVAYIWHLNDWRAHFPKVFLAITNDGSNDAHDYRYSGIFLNLPKK